MAKEIQISSDDLSREGYSNLATKTPDNKLNASRIDTEASRAELEKLKKALAEKTSSIQGVTEADLTALLEETQDQEDPASTEEDPNPKQVSEKSNVPANIKSLANVARAQVKATFGNVADKDYASHMSNMRALLIKMIPGLEVSSVEDVADALYQSDTYINKLIDYLEYEAGNKSTTLNFGITGSWNPISLIEMLWGKISGSEDKKLAPGMYPSGNIEFKDAETKQEYITAMLTKLTAAMKGRKPGEWFSKETAQDSGWLGLALTGAYISGKIAVSTLNALMNKVTFGLWSKGTGGIIQGDPNAINKAKKVAGLAKKAWGMRPGAKTTPTTTPAGAPTATPGATPAGAPSNLPIFRELDPKIGIEKAVQDGILKELYNQRVTSGTLVGAPAGTGAGGTLTLTDAIPDAFIESIKNDIDKTGQVEYQNRVSRFLAISTPPVRTGNTAKDIANMDKWKGDIEKVIRGNTNPSLWDKVVARATRSPIPGAPVGSHADFQNRLIQASLDAKAEKILVGTVEIPIKPGAKTPILEVRNIIEQIGEQEKKIADLAVPKKKLEARLADEKLYTKAVHTLGTIDAQITAKSLEVKNAQRASTAIYDSHKTIINHTGGPNTIDTTALNNDPSYSNAETDRLTKEGELQKLKDAKTQAGTTKTALEGKYTNINRGLTVDATGALTDSITMQKINSAGAGGTDVGVKEQIRLAEAEITRLNGELDAKLTALNGMNAEIPTRWNKAGINIGTERVSNLSQLVEKLARAMVKK